MGCPQYPNRFKSQTIGDEKPSEIGSHCDPNQEAKKRKQTSDCLQPRETSQHEPIRTLGCNSTTSERESGRLVQPPLTFSLRLSFASTCCVSAYLASRAVSLHRRTGRKLDSRFNTTATSPKYDAFSCPTRFLQSHSMDRKRIEALPDGQPLSSNPIDDSHSPDRWLVA
jgi:hypothetical protein